MTTEIEIWLSADEPTHWRQPVIRKEKPGGVGSSTPSPNWQT
jgi:hypothetical protein